MKIIFVLLSLYGLLSPAVVREHEFVSGKVEFTIKNLGLNVNGTMGGVAIQLQQPSADAGTWSIAGTADPATISTGINLRDKHLQKSDYFDVKNYAVIRLQSVAIKAKGKESYEGNFLLTIKNISKNVMIPFTIKTNGNTVSMQGEFVVNRLDYRLGEESTILADKVKIKVSVVFNN